MNGLTLIALRSRFLLWGAALFLSFDGGTASAAGALESVRGEPGEGQDLGVANFTERAVREQPGRSRSSKAKPFRLRYRASRPTLPIDPALVGRETSPRQNRKQGLTSSASNRGPLVEADGTGSTFGPASVGTAPSPSASFPALLDDGFSSIPDTQGAVGPNHLMTTLASQIRIQNRAGTTNLTMTLSNFWASTPGRSGMDVYDPRLVYDPLGQRWIHVANANPGDTNAGLLIAVSQTTDPTANWNRYFIVVDAVDGIFIDSPNVGFTKDWITVSANTYDRTNFDYFSQDIWAFNKTRLYAGLSPQFTHILANVPGGPPNIPVPMSTYDATNGVQYFVGHYDEDFADAGYLQVYSISGAVGSEVFTPGALITDIGVGSPPWSAFAPNDDNFAPQAGTTNKIYLGDCRIVNGAYRESSSTLWVVHTIFLPADAPTHSAVQWWEFTPGGAVVQRGRINDATAAKFFAYPSIAVSRGLDVVVGYTRFAATQFPSANYSYRVDDDLLSTMRPDTVLKAGESNFVAEVNGYNVWGDWSATAVDPVNDTDLWTLQEYAAPHVLVTNVENAVTNIVDGSRWGTWWGRISPIRDLTLTMTGSPDSIVAGANVTYSLSFTNARPPGAQPQIVPGVRVVDTLPSGSVFVSASASQGSCGATSGVVTCNFGDLVAGATGQVTIVATLLNNLNAINTATVSASGPDPIISGNTVTVNTAISASADLALLMSYSPDPVTVSNQLVFTLTVTNRGPSLATAVMVTNTLPSNVTYVSSNPNQGSCSRIGSIVTCTLGNIAGGAAVNVGITVIPIATGQFTNQAKAVTSAFDPAPSNNATLAVARGNAAPVIGIISDRTISEDSALGPVSFSVGDAETPGLSLTVLGFSSNPSIVPNTNITFGGIGTIRTVTVTPASNANGIVTITRVVMDTDGGTGTNSFQLTITPVNDPPFISDIANQTVIQNRTLGPVPFTVADIESGATGLTVSGASSNPTLVPNANIQILGTGANRSFSISPATGQTGMVNISISASDGLSITNKTFVLTVLPMSAPPSMSDLVDRSVNEDTSTGPIPFTVGGAGSLVPTGFSSNQALVPNGNITFAGSGANRTVTVIPATNQFGTATITVSVSDGNGATNDSFVLTVNPVNDAPTLNTISDVTANEDSGTIVVNLAAIGTGATNESELLTITASSSNPGLIPPPFVSYTNPNPSGTLSFTPTPNSNGTATITVQVNDNVASNSITTRMFSVNILPVNDPPVISDLTDRTINEDGSTNISFTIGDIETAATSLTLLGRSSNTSLVPDANILFSGTGSNRAVTVTPAPNANGTCLIMVIVSDGKATNSDTFLLTVQPVNDAPTIATIADRSVNEDAGTNISFTIGDLETPVAILTVAPTSSNPSLVPNVNLVISGSGANRTLMATPAANQFGSTTVTLTVNDGTGASNATSFLLTVVPVNDPPTLDPIASVTLAEDSGQQTINLSGIGPGGVNEVQSLSVSASSSNPGLIPTPQVTYTSANPTGTLRFTPAADSNGVAIITVTVDDGGTVNRTFTRMFTVTINDTNDSPTISDLGDLTINEDAVTNRTLTIGDSDNPANSLTLQALSSNTELIVPGGITFSGSGTNRTVTLRPLTNQFGSATITLIVSDPGQATASDSFELTVLPVNDPPSISAFSNVTLSEDSVSNSIPFTVDSSEVLPSSLTVRATSSNPVLLPTNNIALAGSGNNRNVSLSPVTNQFGTSLITVIVSDGVSSSSNSFLLTVLSVNDLPSLSTFSNRAIDEDGSTGLIDFTIGDVETASANLQLSGSSSDSALVSSSGIDFGGSGTSRTVSIQPRANRFGSATIAIKVADSNGGAVTNSFVLTVNAVNDPPVLNSVANVTTNRDSGPVTLSLTGIGPGGSGEVQALSIVASSSNPDVVPHPTISYTSPAPTGSLTFTPMPNTNGSATITITVTDDAPTNNTFVRTFVVTTVTQNRPPTLNPLGNRIINEDAGPQIVNFDGVSAGAPDENQLLSVTASSSNTGLIPTPSVTYTSPATNGFLTFTPTLNSSGVATITVTVNDNGPLNSVFSQMFTVTVTSVNDSPTLSPITDKTTAEDTPLSFSVTVGDVDNSNSALVLSGNSSNTNLINPGSFSFSGSGSSRSVTITPVTNASGSAFITLSVRDGIGGSSSNTFRLTVNPTADSPSISAIANLTVAEDSQTNIDFTVSDPEGPAAALMLTATSSNAGLLPASGIQFGGSGANRSVALTPLLNRVGSATVTVVATAGSGATASDSFVVTVTNVNDAPTLSPLPDLTINEDTATGPLSITVGDFETPLANLAPSANSSNPSLVPSGNIVFGGTGPDRTVTITPALHQSGASTITLILSDGNGGTTNTSFVLTVAPVNDPPTLDAISNIITNKDPGVILVNLSGLSAGGGESQPLTVTAVSSNPSLIPTPGVSYTSPNPSGTLSLAPLANATGLATITVTVNDQGGSNNVVMRSFTVLLNPVNAPPTISAIASQQTNEDTPMTTGFVIGDRETLPMNLILSATSSDTTLVPNTNIFFSGSSSNRTITVLPATNQFGTTLITVRVSDGVATNSASFGLAVNPVNDFPTLDVIPNFSTNSSASGVYTVPISGISSGAANENQTLTIIASSSDIGLLPHPNVSYSSPATTGTLTLRPGNGQQGNATITVNITEFGNTNNVVIRTFQVNIKAPANVPPTMSIIPNQTMMEDTMLGPIGFTIGDSTTAPGILTLRVDSSNPTLLPVSNIVLGGSGADRNVTLTPAPNQSGVATVLLTVIDSAFGASNQMFTVTVTPVNDPPAITGVGPQTAVEDTTIGPLAFNVTDLETPASRLIVTATSGNQALVPNANIVLGGSGTNRAVLITPATNQFGFGTITLWVSDGVSSNSTTFAVAWNPANDPPTLSDIADQTMTKGSTPPALAFTVGDVETPAGSLTLTAASSNPALVPTKNIVFGGLGVSRTVTVTPLANLLGTTTITITASDGAATAVDTFLLTVSTPAVPNAPPTLDAITNLNLIQNATIQTVNLTGISSGSASEAQTVMVAASSSNPALLPNPIVSYNSPDSVGTLILVPYPNTNGTAIITVRVNDGQPQSNVVTRTFVVTINASPTVMGPTNVVMLEDGNVSGIPFTIGDLETPGGLTVQTSVSNPNLLPAGSLTLGGVGANRTLAVRPFANQSGFSMVTLNVIDGFGNVSISSFLLTVVPINDPPTLSPPANLSVLTNAGLQSFNLSGITSGAGNESQVLSVQATSANPSVIPDPSITYSSPGNTGLLTFTPVANATGVVVITVKVTDDGGTSNGGADSISRAFTVTVSPSSGVPPSLQIEQVGGNVVLSWPTGSGAGWVLQHNTNITNRAGWRDVGIAPIIVNGRYTVSVSATSAARFYRLSSPPPPLQIERADGNVVISWPTGGETNWVLQQKSNVADSGGWAFVGILPSIVGGRYTVSVEETSAARFYRLCGGCVP